MRSLLGCTVLFALAVPAFAADPTVSDSVRPFVERDAVAGAVLAVAGPEKTVTVEAVGFADRENKVAMTPDRLFWIASMTKPMTAAGLLMLVDEGKVKLDDPVEKYLPEFKSLMVIAESGKDQVLLKKPKRAPTLCDCLRHTSGMPFGSVLDTPTIDAVLLRDSVRVYAITPLAYEPGAKYVYSNAGINTAGRVIEVASGMSYEEFMAKRLFAPLGMTDTTWRPAGDALKRVAKTYKPTKDGKSLESMPILPLSHPLSDPKRQPCPGGGLFSTAKDVTAFGQMILRGGTSPDGKRLLSEAAIRELTGTQTDELLNKGKGEGGYGLGFSTTRKAKPDGPAVAGPCGHGGAYATNLWIDPEKKLVLVYMVQHDGFANDGGKARGAFEKAAAELYAK